MQNRQDNEEQKIQTILSNIGFEEYTIYLPLFDLHESLLIATKLQQLSDAGLFEEHKNTVINFFMTNIYKIENLVDVLVHSKNVNLSEYQSYFIYMAQYGYKPKDTIDVLVILKSKNLLHHINHLLIDPSKYEDLDTLIYAMNDLYAVDRYKNHLETLLTLVIKYPPYGPNILYAFR